MEQQIKRQLLCEMKIFSQPHRPKSPLQGQGESPVCQIHTTQNNSQTSDLQGAYLHAAKDAETDIQDLTNRYILLVDKHLTAKEKEIMSV